MHEPSRALDWKERTPSRSSSDKVGQTLLRRSRPRKHFLDPQLPGPRRAYPADDTESRRHTVLRRALLFVALICLTIFGAVWAERWWTDVQYRQWLETARAESMATVAHDHDPAPGSSQVALADLQFESTAEAMERGLAARALPKTGEPVGKLRVPGLDVEGVVEHGETSKVLRRAIGHLPGTALPGQGGNVVLAGHRDSFFRGLRRITQGDLIEFETPYGTHRYLVDGLRIVGPYDSEVLADGGEERLTLITCYPFDYVGPAPRRFVVTARPAANPESS